MHEAVKDVLKLDDTDDIYGIAHSRRVICIGV